MLAYEKISENDYEVYSTDNKRILNLITGEIHSEYRVTELPNLNNYKEVDE